MAHPSSGNDWIEIYNTTGSAIDLAGWTLVDSTSTMKTLSGSLNSSSFVFFEVSNRLNNSGDYIYLKDVSGNTIDSYSYTSDPGSNVSIGRMPDGASFQTLASTSQGSTNGSSSSAPSPTPSTSSTPTPSPSPTPTPSSTPSSTASPTTSSKPAITFTLSSVPSNINSDQEFEVSVSASNLDPNTIYYLKGAFQKGGSSNYFGKTQVSGNWIKNNQTYLSQYQITTDGSGGWNGKIKITPDEEDGGFTGSGSYIFKVGRYTKTGSGPSWSNESTVNITTSEKSQGATTNDEIAKSSPPQSTASIVNSGQTQKKKLLTLASASAELSASVAGIEANDQEEIIESYTNPRQNYYFYSGVFILILGISYFLYKSGLLLKLVLNFKKP